MKNIRQIKFIKYMWLVIGLHILNFSVDNPDFHTGPEDLSYNEIETIVEFALEEILGIEDAIPEYDDADADNTMRMQKQVVVALYWHEVATLMPQNNGIHFIEKNKIPSYEFSFYTLNSSDRNFQPPEA